jgi:hypothetical protein
MSSVEAPENIRKNESLFYNIPTIRIKKSHLLPLFCYIVKINNSGLVLISVNRTPTP